MGARSFRAELEELASRLDLRIGVLHEQWDGSAAAAHGEAQTRWDDGFAVMRGAPTDMRSVAGRCQPDDVATARMILQVESLGYADAAGALLTGNQAAAGQHGELAGRLDGLAGMAGDDDTAADPTPSCPRRRTSPCCPPLPPVLAR